jgi:hypothetical protein
LRTMSFPLPSPRESCLRHYSALSFPVWDLPSRITS